MIKSVFVGLNLEADNYEELGRVGANHFIVAGQALDEEKWWILKRIDAKITICLNAFDIGGCPLDPMAKEKLASRINEALKWDPKEIWLDHFRFDGHWESSYAKASEDKVLIIPGTHKPCKWCQEKDRAREIAKLALWTKSIVPNSVLLGYFAVPFKLDSQTKLASELGQDHRLVGKIFDMASPMLYHRMIKKPVSYISEYVAYLHEITLKPVLPIIQIKDMPDDLPDTLSWEEMELAFEEAVKSSSIGVSIFMWEHAIEKEKITWIKRLFGA